MYVLKIRKADDAVVDVSKSADPDTDASQMAALQGNNDFSFAAVHDLTFNVGNLIFASYQQYWFHEGP